MASLQDYLNNANQPVNPVEEKLAKNLAKYASNKQVLEALGQKDESNPFLGLLSTVGKALSIPGNLVRGGIAEATGVANQIPQLANQSGFQELLNLASSKTKVGMGDFPLFKTKPGESNISRFTKLGGALTGDILTDPLSYITAPASIARKSAGTLLMRHAMGPESTLLNEIATVSKKGNTLIDELASATPQAVAAKTQRELALTVEPGTPLDVIANMSKETLAKQQLANYLGEGLQAGGRKELVKRLEVLTGDKITAENIYKTLPEDVRGGIVLSGPLGKPLKDAEGKYLRLTQGLGNYPGAEVLNKARLALSVFPGAAFNAQFAGKAGEVYSAAIKGIAKEQDGVFRKAANIESDVPAYARASNRQRLVDYVLSKDAAKQRSINLTNLQGRSRGAVAEVINTGEKFGDETTLTRKEYEKAVENSFFAPQVAHEALTDAQRAGLEAGAKLRAHMSQLFEEAKELGLDIGQIGENYSPLMYTKETYDEVMKTEAGRVFTEGLNPFAGRDSFIRFFNDAKIAEAHGYALDPNNPNVVALDARKVNEVMEKEGDFRRFETDPVKVFGAYADNLSNKIATRHFINDLVSTGVGIMDAPHIDRAITKYESAMLQDVAAKLYPEIKKVSEVNLKLAEKELSKLINVKKFNDLKAEIAAIRAKFDDNYRIAQQMEKDAIAKLDIAEQKVQDLYPKATEIQSYLVNFSKFFSANQEELVAKESVARSLRAKLARATGTATETEIILEEANRKLGFTRMSDATRNAWLEVKADMESKLPTYTQKIPGLTKDKETAVNELAAARQTRDELKSQSVADVQKQLDEYIGALEERNLILKEREDARTLRESTRRDAYTAQKELGLDGIKTVKGLTNDFLDKSNALSEATWKLTQDLNELIRGGATNDVVLTFKKTAEENIKLLKEAKSASKKTLNTALDLTSKRFNGIVRDYAKSVINATLKLSKEQRKAFDVLNSENNIQKYIDIVANSNRNSMEVFQAMGDLNKTFLSIRSMISDDAYKALSKSEQEFLDEYSYRTVTQTARKKEVASPLGMELKTTGKAVAATNAATANLYVDSGVKKWLEGIYHIQANPTSWEKVLDNVFDPLLSIWKSAITVGRGPGFVATNTAGGIFMNHQGGVSIKEMKLAGDVILKFRSITSQVNKEFPDNPVTLNNQIATERLNNELSKIKVGKTDMATVFAEFFARGAFADTETNLAVKQMEKGGLRTAEAAFGGKSISPKTYITEPSGPIEEKFRRGIDFAMTNKLQVFLNDMNQSAEMFMRLGAFINGVVTYNDFKAAMDKVHLLHFDYQDLSSAEEWVRRIAPFYTWSRNNIPAQLRSMFMQPGKIQRAMYANEEFKNTFGADGEDSWVNQVLPEYMQNSDGFLSKFKFGNNTLGFFSKMPYEDLNKFFQVNEKGLPGIRTQSLLGMLGPIGTPLQMLSGTNYGTGQPLSQAVAVPDIYRAFGLIPGTNIQKVEGGGTTMGGAAALGLQNLLPFLGVGQKVLSSANVLTGGVTPKIVKDAFLSPNQQESGIASLLSTTGLINLIGLQATMATPKSISGTIYGFTKAQAPQISKFTQDAGIDTAWVRKQLANYTPQEVAMMIQSGQGRVKEADGKSTISSKQAKVYTDAINSLNSPG